jgi:protein-tyrosine phosphatase
MAGVFWIYGQPALPPLAVVLCPRGGWWLREDLESYQRAGVQTLVSLLDTEQTRMLDLTAEGRSAERLGLRFLSFPLPDHSLPPDETAFRNFVAELAEGLRSGERIGVHCWGSIGRATLVAAGALIHLGWPAEDALAAIEQTRGCPVPDTDEQREWILRYQPQP